MKNLIVYMLINDVEKFKLNTLDFSIRFDILARLLFFHRSCANFELVD